MYKAIKNENEAWWSVYSEDGILQGVIHMTQHPTIRYEAFWDQSGKSERCNTVEGGLLIIEKDHKLHLLRVLEDFVERCEDVGSWGKTGLGSYQQLDYFEAKNILREHALLLV